MLSYDFQLPLLRFDRWQCRTPALPTCFPPLGLLPFRTGSGLEDGERLSVDLSRVARTGSELGARAGAGGSTSAAASGPGDGSTSCHSLEEQGASHPRMVGGGLKQNLRILGLEVLTSWNELEHLLKLMGFYTEFPFFNSRSWFSPSFRRNSRRVFMNPRAQRTTHSKIQQEPGVASHRAYMLVRIRCSEDHFGLVFDHTNPTLLGFAYDLGGCSSC